MKHGYGTEKFGNGDFYVGNYVNGKPDGYGEYYWSTGCQYKGFFKNGLRHGKGVWRKGTGKSDKYDGEWLNDKKYGYGVYNWASGNFYKGNYFDDLRHGYGEMFWIDGSIYKGTWEKGIQHGEGELHMSGKKQKIGQFKNNIFISEIVTDQEVFTFENQTDSLSPKSVQKGTTITPKNGMSINLGTNIRTENDEDNSKTRASPIFKQTLNKIFTPTYKQVPSQIQKMDTLANFKKNNHDASVQADLPTNNTTIRYANKTFNDATHSTKSNDLNTTFNYAVLNTSYNEKHSPNNIRNTGIPSHNIYHKKLPMIITNRLFYQRPPRIAPQAKSNNRNEAVRSSKNSKQASLSPDRRNLTMSPADKFGGNLTQKELARWNYTKEKSNIYSDKFNDINDPEVCTQIRAIINPPIWKPWAKKITG